jgi:hypothetical protein
MSYSIPNPMFNIEENKNNELKLLYKNEEIILTISTGKYNIDEVIEILNEKLKNKNLNESINIKLNKQQKIILELTNSDDEISIIPTILSKDNLGFIAQDIEQIIPQAVSISDKESGMLSLKTDFLVPYLVKAIQEQNQTIQELSNRLIKLESK